ncbi:chloride channel protein CLC-e-like [Hibiscus syriacus]|uniref:chloride channel protein CLC-e-like n=1 Tax=Hibiscus syriacus TaxID=106335 RepID=UPI001921A6CC|nr:chloride channel protein CLC-e-like [Hibiscus syriacus]
MVQKFARRLPPFTLGVRLIHRILLFVADLDKQQSWLSPARFACFPPHLHTFPVFSSPPISTSVKLRRRLFLSTTTVSPFTIQDQRPTFIPDAVPDSSDNQTSSDSVAVDDNFNDSGVILSACLVGIFTGIAVVLFNNGVHEIRNFFWDRIPSRGASWLREEPLDPVWVRVISAPACIGLIVSVLNAARNAVSEASFSAKGALGSVLKVLAACFTLGTGNSLGPEGPSVEIGSSIAKEIHSSLDKNPQTKLSLLAAGSAAGISSGFNAAVAGFFFSVESVLWPSSPADSSVLLVSEICSLDSAKCKVPWTATPTMDILSAEMIMNKHGLNQVPVMSCKRRSGTANWPSGQRMYQSNLQSRSYKRVA